MSFLQADLFGGSKRMARVADLELLDENWLLQLGCFAITSPENCAPDGSPSRKDS